MQHSTQPLSLQHGLADSSSSTTGLKAEDQLMSLQTFADRKRLEAFAVHECLQAHELIIRPELWALLDESARPSCRLTHICGQQAL